MELVERITHSYGWQVLPFVFYFMLGLAGVFQRQGLRDWASDAVLLVNAIVLGGSVVYVESWLGVDGGPRVWVAIVLSAVTWASLLVSMLLIKNISYLLILLGLVLINTVYAVLHVGPVTPGWLVIVGAVVMVLGYALTVWQLVTADADKV